MAKKFQKAFALFFFILTFFTVATNSVAAGTPLSSAGNTRPASLFAFGLTPANLRESNFPEENFPLPVGKSARSDTTLLYPGGVPFGVKFITEGVMVVGFCDVATKDKNVNPSLDAGLRQGDLILKVNDSELCGADELTSVVESCKGKPLKLLCRRDGKDYTTMLHPAYSAAEGRYKTGVYVRDSGAGIGTVTFIIPETFAFAGLGHGICDADSGKLIPMQRGTVADVTINGVVKGLPGAPGEVKGYFSSGKTGSLIGNTECGVYGVMTKLPASVPFDKPVPVGKRDEVQPGKAWLYCTLDVGGVCRYEIEISDIHRDSLSNKCFTVKVTDPALLEKSGGIVQGMSGSPILQNGKLVGAVTHVLINDPTTGYGIFIENMLNQMGDLAA